jgi:hypothetical protein
LCLRCSVFLAISCVSVASAVSVAHARRDGAQGPMMDKQAADMSAVSDAQLRRRVRALKAAFQRQLGRRPSTIERMLRDHAAVCMARLELAAADPKTSANDFRALDSAARRARADFEAVVAKAAAKPAASTLDQYLAEHPDEAAE